MKTYVLQEVTDTCLTRINELLHMLSPEAPVLTHTGLQKLVRDESFMLFITEDSNGVISGMLSVTVCHTLSRNKYWIEDVIVDSRYRGSGIGRTLVKAALKHIRAQERTPAIYLTSNPSRTAARALYLSEGFEEYETGVFRIITEHQDGQ